MENYYRRFPDWNSFLRFALQRSDSRNKTSRQMHDLDWFGGVTWKEAWELATHGWKEGAEKIKHYRTEIFNLLSEHIPTQSVVNATTGYAVNVGAYLSNDPECFIYRELNNNDEPPKQFRLVVSVARSSSVSSEVIITRGAMICAMVDAIEMAGHRVEIICNEKSESYGRVHEIDIVVKQYNQPLNIAGLSFCLAHPAMSRRLLFSADERTGWADFARNYGTPVDATDQGDNYFGAMRTSTCPDIKEVESEIIERMVSMGIILEKKPIV